MNNAQIRALELLDSIGWSKPGDISIEEIAFSKDIFINRVPLSGSEGFITIKKNSAIISVNNRINYQH